MNYHPDTLHWLAALHFKKIGPVKLHRWLSLMNNDIKQIFSAPEKQLHSIGLTTDEVSAVKNPNWSAAKKDLLWCEKNSCHIVLYSESEYPFLLKQIYSPPLLLFVRGNKNMLTSMQLAMVGSRKATTTGIDTAYQFAASLAKQGLTITSGMALGIDAASHRGAMQYGHTVAVMGAGLQHIYPAVHRKLADDIMQHGALVSEFVPSLTPRARNFPLRNRLISGLSKGVFIIEAALKSGSLITAKYALEQNREVFAMPGSIHNPQARGCHFLLRQGAKLVETVTDILDEFDEVKQKLEFVGGSPHMDDLDDKQRHLLAHVGYEVTSMEVIMMRSGLTAGQVSSMLLSLELKGYVQIALGGYTRTTSKVS